jgi:hypothetical protein
MPLAVGSLNPLFAGLQRVGIGVICADAFARREYTATYFQLHAVRLLLEQPELPAAAKHGGPGCDFKAVVRH